MAMTPKIIQEKCFPGVARSDSTAQATKIQPIIVRALTKELVPKLMLSSSAAIPHISTVVKCHANHTERRIIRELPANLG